MTNAAENTTQELTEERLEEMSMTLYERSLGVAIIDEASYGTAGAIIKEAKLLRTQRTDWFKDMIDAATAALQKVRDKRTEATKPLDEIITSLTGQQNKWLREEHDRKEAEQRRLQAEERERVRKEQEKLARQAEKLEEKGKTEKAEALMEQAAELTAEPVFAEQAVAAPIRTTSAAGVAATSFTQMETEITVTDPMAFLKELLAKGHKPTMITIGVAPLKAWVKANDITTFAGLHIKKVPKARNR